MLYYWRRVAEVSPEVGAKISSDEIGKMSVDLNGIWPNPCMLTQMLPQLRGPHGTCRLFIYMFLTAHPLLVINQVSVTARRYLRCLFRICVMLCSFLFAGMLLRHIGHGVEPRGAPDQCLAEMSYWECGFMAAVSITISICFLKLIKKFYSRRFAYVHGWTPRKEQRRLRMMWAKEVILAVLLAAIAAGCWVWMKDFVARTSERDGDRYFFACLIIIFEQWLLEPLVLSVVRTGLAVHLLMDRPLAEECKELLGLVCSEKDHPEKDHSQKEVEHDDSKAGHFYNSHTNSYLDIAERLTPRVADSDSGIPRFASRNRSNGNEPAAEIAQKQVEPEEVKPIDVIPAKANAPAPEQVLPVLPPLVERMQEAVGTIVKPVEEEANTTAMPAEEAASFYMPVEATSDQTRREEAAKKIQKVQRGRTTVPQATGSAETHTVEDANLGHNDKRPEFLAQASAPDFLAKLAESIDAITVPAVHHVAPTAANPPAQQQHVTASDSIAAVLAKRAEPKLSLWVPNFSNKGLDVIAKAPAKEVPRLGDMPKEHSTLSGEQFGSMLPPTSLSPLTRATAQI